jgi:hypothetical protein
MEIRICDTKPGEEFEFKFSSFESQNINTPYLRILPLNEKGLWIRNRKTGLISMVINTNAPVIVKDER